MFGTVVSINQYDISLALPNNLTGFIPLTSISEQTSQMVESAMDVDLESDEDIDKHLDLKSYFHLGQFLRAKVVSTRKEANEGQKSRKHIELSVYPREVNEGLAGNTVIGATVQGSIASIEDHGMIMDLGFPQKAARGFLPNEELPPDLEASKLREGTVLLCIITGSGADGKIVKLSASYKRMGNTHKNSFIKNAPTVDVLLPGTAVEILVSSVTDVGVLGKAMGLIDVTVDLIHSQPMNSDTSLEEIYTPKQKVKGRILCNFPDAEKSKIIVSLLDHVLNLQTKSSLDTALGPGLQPLQESPLSTVVEQAKVIRVLGNLGLILDLGFASIPGFVHISQVSDSKIETLTENTGNYKLGSTHRARILGYNPMDGLYIVSLENSVIEQPFLRLEDVKIGQNVTATMEKLLVSAEGVTGILVKLAKGISGLVPEMHLSDIKLQHPEQRFKEGREVKARVLSINLIKRQIRLTMKKTLVNSNEAPWAAFEDLVPGLRSHGTIVNLLPAGAVVQFYGSVRAFLPASEMSESYIENPESHFRLGQTVHVRIISVEPSAKKMLVSCRSLYNAETTEDSFSKVAVGDIVNASILEKGDEGLVVETVETSLKGTLPTEHLVDGSIQKVTSTAKKLRIGQVLKDLVILNKQNQKRLIRLSSKLSLVGAAKLNKLPKAFEEVVEGAKVSGFVANITDAGAFVRFAGNVTGLLPKSKMPIESVSQPQFGLRKDQSISTVVVSVDYLQQRFILGHESVVETKLASTAIASTIDHTLINPADGLCTSLNDFSLDKLTKAKITSVKETQINVQLADGVQGRIDVSEVFDNFEAIKDPSKPLKDFHKNQVLPVRIMGIHDTRNHRFLPISHRGKAPVFELTAKPKHQSGEEKSNLTLDKVKEGQSHMVFVNNVRDDHVWVNLAPNVRGRIAAMDLSDDVTRMNNIGKHFPVGSALQARIVRVDVMNDRLDLAAKSTTTQKLESLDDITQGMVLPGKITKITERQIIVQLSEAISGPVHLVDLSDDYTTADPSKYQKNQMIRLCVKQVDLPNKRITLSARPSRVLSSALPIADPDLSSISQVSVNGVYRGFVKNVADNGLFVSLSSNVTAFVRISDLSDSYLKDWKADFEVGQLVKGKVVEVDSNAHHVRMSLKASHLDPNYKPPIRFEDLTVGQSVNGKVRKVQDYGVFIVVDDSANVSGLCHRSEISDRRAANPLELYKEGDEVKARVLKIDADTRRISFGLKASYFVNETADEDEEDGDSDLMGGVEIAGDSDSDESTDMDTDGAPIEVEHLRDDDFNMDDAQSEADSENYLDKQNDNLRPTSSGLQVGGFDWSGGLSTAQTQDPPSDNESIAEQSKRKRKRKAAIQVDKTGDLDANGPQTSADFERLLLGSPNTSQLWIDYMAYHISLSEVDKARQIGERALQTINIREQTEKKFVWTALLNLEMEYGNEESLDSTFQRACQYNDNLEMHEILASIYIQSKKYPQADALFQKAIKKHSQNPDIYPNYATFLMDQMNDPARARALLPRAMQALPPHTHVPLTAKFAKLEFTSPHGEKERGRTMFEGLITTFPKKLDLRHVLLDLEINQGSGNKERVRQLFERTVGNASGDTEMKINKPRQINAFFNKWEAFEEKEGSDLMMREKVRGLRERALREAEGRRAANREAAAAKE